MGLWKLIWILFVMRFVCGEISVQFQIGHELHVAVGQTLLLEAELQKDPDDKIDMVTWEREKGSENVRISQNDRTSLEKDDSLLRIKRVRPEDFGTYKVTVTDSDGQQQHASIQVRKMDEPPKASIPSVLECLVENANVTQWDIPRFTWVVDDAVVTNQMALLENGSKLNISEVHGKNYKCVVSSSLGVSTTHFQMAKISESQTCRCVHGGLIVVGLFCLVVLCAVGAIATWKYRTRTRGERMPVPIVPNNQ